MHARETITEVIEKIKTRNKHIKIADGSDGGWETVRQYQSGPVASDSDDESKINKAENSALRKRNLNGKKAAVKPNNGGQHASSQYVATFPAKNQPFREPQTWYNGSALYHGQPIQISAPNSTTSRVLWLRIFPTLERPMSLQPQTCHAKTKIRPNSLKISIV